MSEAEVKLYIFVRAMAEASKKLELDPGKIGLAMVANGFELMFNMTEPDAYHLATISIHNASDILLSFAAKQRLLQDNTAIAVEDMGRG